MLLQFSTLGFKLFHESVELSMIAPKGINTIDITSRHVLKSSIIYGANNSGKSNFINALQTMKSMFLKGTVKDFPFYPYKNFYDESKSIAFEVEFLLNGFDYTYGIETIDENSLCEYLDIDNIQVFSRGSNNNTKLNKKFFPDDFYHQTYELLNNNELFITKALSFSKKMTNIHVENINTFFNKLRFFDNNNKEIFADIMLEYLEDDLKRMRLNSLLINADISLVGKELTDDIDIPNFDEIRYLEQISENEKRSKMDLSIVSKVMRIKSIYEFKGEKFPVPSNVFDSIGTNKFTNLLLLIMKTIDEEEILFIDEIDNSLHYRATRELIKIMNSNINKKSQFIMTAHDIKLLTPLLFRKDQINFIERTQDTVEMFSLGDFEDIRNDSNFENYYIKNKVGALPNPDLQEVIKTWEELIIEENREN